MLQVKEVWNNISETFFFIHKYNKISKTQFDKNLHHNNNIFMFLFIYF